MTEPKRAPRVLLVEDVVPILDRLDALFSQQGFLTTLAIDGEVALRELIGPRGRETAARLRETAWGSRDRR